MRAGAASAAFGCASALAFAACGGAEFTNAADAGGTSDATVVDTGIDARSGDGGTDDAGGAHDAGHDTGVIGSDGGHADASPPRDAATDASGDASDAEGGTPPCSGAFPTFDRGCNVLNNGSDCAIANHRLDCCGTLRAYGINTAQVSNFNAAENLWNQTCPACACPAGATLADDGTTGTSVSVKCVTTLMSSVCTTHAQ